MRYFVELAYNGTSFCGWQKQPNAMSVQEVIEKSLSTILRRQIEVVGCGRTDAGVHAKQFFLHFDNQGNLPENLLFRLNRVLPAEIALFRIFEVKPAAHARFDATWRAYEYCITWRKNPFGKNLLTYFSDAHTYNIDLLNQAAALLLQFEDFHTFCKTGTDVSNTNCRLIKAEWECKADEQMLIFHIRANRFLRGMVRLVVGMCVNVARGRLSLEEVENALRNKKRLVRAESAPPDGLYLTEVTY